MNYRLMALAACVIAAIPAAASAQTISTDCYSHKGNYHCTTTVRPSLGQSIAAIGEILQARRDAAYYRKAEAQTREYNRKRAELAALQRLPKNQSPDFQVYQLTMLISNQDCPGAQAYARETENPAIIQRSIDFCGKPAS